MPQCDICNAFGTGTTVAAADMSDAVRKGFNPWKAGLAADLSADFGMGNAYDLWREAAISGPLSKSDRNVCEKCMAQLRPYLAGKAHTGNQHSGCASMIAVLVVLPLFMFWILHWSHAVVAD